MIFPFSFWKARTLQGIDIELSMRAIQERRVVASHAVWPWPNVIFDSNGNQLNGNTGNPVGDYPADDTYDADITYSDTFYGDPTGTKGAFLVNDLIDACISTVGFGDYIDPALIEGQSSLTFYTASIFPASGSATTANYLTKLEDCKTGIRLLTDIFRQANQVQRQYKSGGALPTNPCAPTVNSVSLKITDATSFGACATCTGAFPPVGIWDGTGFVGPTGAAPCSYQTVYSSSPPVPGVNGCGLINVGIGNVGATANLVIRRDAAGADQQLWNGLKSDAYPASPIGIYTRSSGCSAGPATLEVVLV